jgi:hypothetical protein
MSRSSIFSFETMRSLSIPGGWLASLGVAMALLCVAEIGARVLMRPIGDDIWVYWEEEPARKFTWYRHLAELGRPPAVLIVGDSTGAMNIDPAGFETGMQDDVYNLASPANYPRAFEQNTLPLLRLGKAPEVVIVSQSPWGFVNSAHVERSERTAMTGILRKRQAGEFVATDWFHLGRLYPARSYLASFWLHNEPVLTKPKQYGFVPLAKPRDRLALAQIQPMANRPGMPPSGFDRARIAPLEALRDIAVQRSFRVIATVGPFRSDAYTDSGFTELVSFQRAALAELVRSSPDHVAVWDLTHLDFLRDSDFNDPLHLAPNAAFELGKYLGARLSDHGNYNGWPRQTARKGASRFHGGGGGRTPIGASTDVELTSAHGADTRLGRR